MNSAAEIALLAIAIHLGKVDKYWIHCIVDPVEWTDPRYYHQN